MTIPGPDGVELDVWDGIFMHEPLRYVSGVILNMYVARLSLEDLIKLLIISTDCLSLHALYYRIPLSDLGKGLVKVENDHELNRMYDLSKLYGTIEVYLDHCNNDLSRYLALPDPNTLTISVEASEGLDSHGNMQDPFVSVEASENLYPTH
nr:transposase, MuDR, MULE transposase domain protein [Tanacetum cinerariifolium]